jgi:hypothetical protein
MDLSKFSDSDLDALESGDIKKLSDAGLDELERQQGAAPRGIKILGPMETLKAMGKDIRDSGQAVKAGYAGLADLVSGNGLDKAVENVGHVQKGEDPTSGAAVIGDALGSQFTPAQIALQAAGGKIAEMVGPAVASALKGWGEKAALNAVGMISSIAKTLNVELPDLAQFLMKPITLGGKEFAPIVKATSDASSMLKDAEVIQRAAGKQLEEIANRMDDAISGAIAWAEENAEPKEVILNLKAMKPAVEELKEKAVGGWEDVAPAVAEKFNGILSALDKFSTKQEGGVMATAFSDLSAMKTKLGGLTNFSSQTDNNLALQQAYGVLAKTLNDAAKKVGGGIAKEYANVNAVYHQVTAIVNALSGKETKFLLKDLFAPGAGAFIGTLVGGLPGLALGATAGALGKTYGYQAIARGLNAVAPVANAAVNVGLRAIPPVARAITDSLTLKKADSEER